MTKRGCKIETKIILLCLLPLLALPSLPAQGAGVMNDDCTIKQNVFEQDWEKYSDLDERIPLRSRSHEAQQYYKLQQQILDLKVEAFLLERDMEIDRLMRLELREYKKALVQNIKVNLLKSFWRLTYITYDTVKSGKGLGESYSKLINGAKVVEKLGAGLKVASGLKPNLAGNTQSIKSSIKNVATSGALEALESMGDPKSIGKSVFEETTKQILPSADLTPDEIEILRKQHLETRLLDGILMESYKLNLERRVQLEDMKTRLEKLEGELAGWKGAEKERVAQELITECKNKKNSADTGNKTENIPEVKPTEEVSGGDLRGRWEGSMTYTKIFNQGRYSEAELKSMVGFTRPIVYTFEKGNQGYTCYFPENSKYATKTSVNGNKISIYDEVKQKVNNTVITFYTKIEGTTSENGKKMSGTFEIGNSSTGKDITGSWLAEKK